MLAVTYKNEAGEKVVHGLEPGQVFGVGRGAESPVRIRHASVSRAHAEFYEADDGNWCVRDVGSSNHTFLNGDQIEVTYIQEGDVIRFGDFSVKVETVPDPVKAGGRRARAPEPEPEPAPAPAMRTAVPEDDGRSGRRGRPSAAPPPEPEPEPEPEPAPPSRRGRPSADPAPAPVAAPAEESAAERRARQMSSIRGEPAAPAAPAKAPARAAAPAPAPEPEPAPGRRPRPSVEPEPAPAPVRARAAPPPEPEPAPPPRRAAVADADDMRRAAPEKKVVPVGVDPAELRAAQDRANKVEDQLREQKSKYDEALRRIEDLEARDGRHDEDLREWQDRYDKAREQTDHVQDLLERARDEIKEHEETIETFEKEVAELESQLKQFEATKEDTAETLTELKSKVVQKDRRIDELQRELDMMEFDLRNAREELESIQNSMNFENTEGRKMEREAALLREVIHEKENHIKSLQIEIEERDKEIYDLKLGTGVKDLQQAKTEMMEKYFAKDKETNDMRERLAKAEQELKMIKGDLADANEKAAESKDIANHPEVKRKDREITRLQADLDNAKDELERLQEKLLAFTPEVKAKLESEIQTLRKKNQALEEKLEESETAATGKGQSDVELATSKRKIGALEAKIEELEDGLDKAKKEAKAAVPAAPAGDGDAALKKQIASLEDKIDSLSLDLRKAKSEVEKWKLEAEKAEKAAKAVPAAAPTKAVEFDKDSALDSLDAIMDLYRSWMSNLGVLKTYGEDIEKGKGNAKAVQDAVDGIGQTLSSIEGDADDMRKELKSLRGAVEKG